MICGFVTDYPVNWYLVSVSIKENVTWRITIPISTAVEAMDPQPRTSAARLPSALNLVYVMLEAAFGLYSGSLPCWRCGPQSFRCGRDAVLAWGSRLARQKAMGPPDLWIKAQLHPCISLINAILLMLAVGAITHKGDPETSGAGQVTPPPP